MALIVFDTNIFIDMLHGLHEATVELGNYDDPAISVVTYMELRSGEWLRPQDKPILDAVLAEFSVLQLSRRIVEGAIAVRGSGLVTPPKLKLPDAIIAATAISAPGRSGNASPRVIAPALGYTLVKQHGAPLVTRNGKDFSKVPVIIHTPYDYNAATGVVSNVKAPFDLRPR
jgi:predicted nucleic acid-binding protein